MPHLRAVRTRPALGLEVAHRLVQQGQIRLDAKDLFGELERSDNLARKINHVYGRHGYFFDLLTTT
ncbi:MAG: hypothetical protein R2724_12770 [Bryobacterales bacterium]